MGNRIHHSRRVFVLFVTVAFVALAFSSCGDHSVYDLLGSQQEGSFALAQRSIETVTNAQYTLAATGGYTEYSFDMHSGPGDVSIDGTYTAPASIEPGDNVAIVTATDRFGSTDRAEITVYDRLTVAPLSTTIPMGDEPVELAVEITGGIGDVDLLSNTVEANTATILDRKIVYTPTESGKDFIELSDAYGSTSVVTVTVYDPDVFSIDPTSAIVAAGETVEFTVYGTDDFTVEPVLYGSISDVGSDTFTFTASEDLTDATEVEVTVTSGELSTSATVYVVIGDDAEPLTVTPADVELNLEASVTLTVSGGVAPYVFELASGDGELGVGPDGVTAVYTAPAQPGVARVRVYDKTESFVVAQIKVKRN